MACLVFMNYTILVAICGHPICEACIEDFERDKER
jgi:hypothetical protein